MSHGHTRAGPEEEEGEVEEEEEEEIGEEQLEKADDCK